MKNEILFIEDVMKQTRLSRPTINKYIRLGTFPAPSQIGPRHAWYASSIEKWLIEQMDNTNDGKQ